MAGIFEVTTENFAQEVLASTQPVLLDFTADWCPPCRMIAPIMADLAAEYDGKLRVGQIDADNNPDILIRYGVMGLPTLLLFERGEPAVRITGFRPKAAILKEIEPHLALV